MAILILLWLWFHIDGIMAWLTASNPLDWYTVAYYNLEHYNQDIVYFEELFDSANAYPHYELLPWNTPAEPTHGGAMASKELIVGGHGEADFEPISDWGFVEEIYILDIYNKETKNLFTPKELNSNNWTDLEQRWFNLWFELSLLSEKRRDRIFAKYIISMHYDHLNLGSLLHRLKKISEKYHKLFKT